MAAPNTRDTFKQYCLRRLGAPVIEINVDDDQVDDRINDALLYYWDYHFDGSNKNYFKYGPITQTDIYNKYVTLPETIMGVTRVFPIGAALSTNNLFNIRYQIALNDLYDLTSTTMVPYYMAMQHIQFLEQLLVGEQMIRYNRHTNICNIDMDWGIVQAGEYFVFECYTYVNPEPTYAPDGTTVIDPGYPAVWGDRWLQRYSTCLIKEQWGSNLIKFKSYKLPGGMEFNAEKIYNDAIKEKAALEHEMISSFSLPVSDMIG